MGVTVASSQEPVVGGGLSMDVVDALLHVQYNIAFKDGQNDILSKIARSELEEMKRASEIFYQRLLKVIPKEGIVEHRMGWNSDTDEPATLTIISREYDSEMARIQDEASDCELYLSSEFEYDCYFWVMTDEKLNNQLIRYDFPYLREERSSANA